LAVLAILAGTACSMPQAPAPTTASDQTSHVHQASHAARPADAQPVLYDSFGTHSYPITTSSADAQRWFDQGLRMVYAFNHAEALKAFPAGRSRGSELRDVLLGHRPRRGLELQQPDRLGSGEERPRRHQGGGAPVGRR